MSAAPAAVTTASVAPATIAILITAVPHDVRRNKACLLSAAHQACRAHDRRNTTTVRRIRSANMRAVRRLWDGQNPQALFVRTRRFDSAAMIMLTRHHALLSWVLAVFLGFRQPSHGQ